MIKKGVLVLIAIRVLPKSTVNQLKNLFNLLEIICSTHFDGLLHRSDFQKAYEEKTLDFILSDKHDGLAVMFD